MICLAMTCDALFVPNGVRMTTVKLKQLFDEKDGVWKVKEPSTLVCADAGTVHPAVFATRDLTKLAQFKQKWVEARKHADRAFPNESDEERDSRALKVINDVLFLKLKTVFSSVRAHCAYL